MPRSAHVGKNREARSAALKISEARRAGGGGRWAGGASSSTCYIYRQAPTANYSQSAASLQASPTVSINDPKHRGSKLRWCILVKTARGCRRTTSQARTHTHPGWMEVGSFSRDIRITYHDMQPHLGGCATLTDDYAGREPHMSQRSFL